MKKKQSSQSIIMMAEGEEAAKNMHNVDTCPYHNPIYRNWWIVGWRNGGGDIMSGVVVTKIQRLIERKELIEKQLKEINLAIEIEMPNEQRVKPVK